MLRGKEIIYEISLNTDISPEVRDQNQTWEELKECPIFQAIVQHRTYYQTTPTDDQIYLVLAPDQPFPLLKSKQHC